METENKDGLLAQEKIENKDVIDTKKLETNDEGDDFEGYSSREKFQLYVYFFFMGVINHLGTILVMTGGRNLAHELKMDNYLTIYTSTSIIFALITRILNSKLFIKEKYRIRILIVCCCMVIGYFIMFFILLLHKYALQNYNAACFVFSFIPCFFLGASYALGESAMLAYLRYFPKTLISGWSSGTGISGLLGGTLNFVSQLSSVSALQYIYLALSVLGPIYLFLFRLTFKILTNYETRMGDKKEKLTKEMSPVSNEENDNQGETNTFNTAPNSIKVLDINAMNKMNENNKSLSWENFKKVMSICGKVLINLGCIYFLQFFCNNTLTVRCCTRVDMTFLPTVCEDNKKLVRKGKFEFVNLFFQIGMFTSKTFIKLVRKIKKITVYTIAISVINMIYILEYGTGFMAWGNFIWLELILGFFGGGTYAGGFYTILNSDQIPDDYKELTVNVATLFNDTGTFLSGIFGFIFLNYWFDKDTPFEGEEIVSDIPCPQ